MDKMPADIAAVRRFSRFYTRQIELLDEGFLQSRFTLTEGRVLYELATRGEVVAAGLGRDLGLDPGYLSRILRRFEADGLIARHPSSTDARQAVLRVTPAGRDAFAPLDSGSRRQVERLLAPLTAGQRTELTAAMDLVERLLGPSERPAAPVMLRGLVTGDLGWIVRRQGMLYAAEYGWDTTFEALVAEILAEFVRSFDAAREAAWIAERDGEILGSVFLVKGSEEVGKLRLLYVEPAARGLGIGRRLVGECIAAARERRYRTLILWTNDILVSARRIYEWAGFRLVEEERHHSFGQDLVGQNWSLEL